MVRVPVEIFLGILIFSDVGFVVIEQLSIVAVAIVARVGTCFRTETDRVAWKSGIGWQQPRVQMRLEVVVDQVANVFDGNEAVGRRGRGGGGRGRGSISPADTVE